MEAWQDQGAADHRVTADYQRWSGAERLIVSPVRLVLRVVGCVIRRF